MIIPPYNNCASGNIDMIKLMSHLSLLLDLDLVLDLDRIRSWLRSRDLKISLSSKLVIRLWQAWKCSPVDCEQWLLRRSQMENMTKNAMKNYHFRGLFLSHSTQLSLSLLFSLYLSLSQKLIMISHRRFGAPL